MKLLFDENLSPRLPAALADVFPGSTHVHESGMGSADDSAIWEYARQQGFTIVSKDSDFQDRSVLHGHPPKFIWIRAENCTTREIEKLLRNAAVVIREFNEDEESHLILGYRRKPESSKKA